MIISPQLEAYILHPTNDEIDEMLSFWAWLLPEKVSSLLITKFGDWFLIDANLRVQFLDLLEGTVIDCAIEKNEIKESSFVEKFKSELSIDWVEVCLSNGLTLSPGNCYGWKVPPVLGGALAFSNIQVFDSRVYQSLNAQIHQQLSVSPKGRKVTGFTAE